MFGSGHIEKVTKELERFHSLPEDTAALVVAVKQLSGLIGDLITELKAARLKEDVDAARGITKPAKAKNPVGGRPKKSSK